MWIQSFLMHRKRQVIAEGESSRPCSVDSVVTQHTVLGPLLYLCHINYLPQRVTSKVRLFADDCLLYRPMHSPCDQLLLQQDLAAGCLSGQLVASPASCLPLRPAGWLSGQLVASPASWLPLRPAGCLSCQLAASPASWLPLRPAGCLSWPAAQTRQCW